MSTTDAYGRRFITADELAQLDEAWKDRTETEPYLGMVWDPATMSMQLQPTSRVVIK